MLSRVVVLGMLMLVAVSPARADVVTLQVLEQRALRDPPTLAIVQARVRRANAEIERIGAAHYPVIGAEVRASASPGAELIWVRNTDGVRYLVQGTRPIGDQGAFNVVPRYEGGVSIEGTLYDFGRTSAALRAARAARSAFESQREVARRELLELVRRSYVGWFHAHALAALADEALTQANDRASRADARIRSGVRPPSDRTLVEVEVLQSELERSRAHGELDAARLVLEEAVGTPLGAGATPDPELASRSTRAPTGDPEAAALAQQRLATLATAHAHGRQHAPVLTASATVGARGQLDEFFPAYQVSTALTIPIWDGGASSAQRDAALAEAAELAAMQQEQERKSRAESKRRELDDRRAQRELEIAQRLVAIGERNLQEAESRYEIGGGSIEAVFDAQVVLHRARTALVTTRTAHAAAVLGVSVQ